MSGLWKGLTLGYPWKQGTGGKITPYSAKSSVHSTSGPALTGLVHFCCMGLSSSATQHSSSEPGRNQQLENLRVKKLLQMRGSVLDRRTGMEAATGCGLHMLTSQLTSQVSCSKLPQQ